MTWRPIGWLAVVVCCLGLFILVFERGMPQGSLGALAESSLLRLDEDAVTRLSVTTVDFTFECALRNGRWRMLSPLATRADAAMIRRMLDALRSSVRREVIDLPRQKQRGLTPASFGLDVPRARVNVGTEQKQEEVFIGSPVPLSDQVYVMLEKGGSVIAASRDIEGVIPAGLDLLRDRMVMPADFGKVVRLEVKHAGGFLQLAFRGGEWRLQQPQEARADAAAVERLIGVLRGLRVEQFVSESAYADPVAYGMGREDAVLEISAWQDGRAERIDLTVGKVKEDSPGLVYARVGDMGGICLLAAGEVSRLAVRADSMLDRRLCDATPAEVASLVLRDGEQKLVLQRQGAEEWMIAEPLRARADASRVGGTLKRLCSLQAEPLLGDAVTNAMAVLSTSAVWRVVLSTIPAVAGTTNGAAAAELPAGRTWSYVFLKDAAGGWRWVLDEASRQVSRVKPTDFPDGVWSGAAEEVLGYMDRTVLDVDPANVRRFVRSGEGVEESVVRDAAGRWTAESPPEARVQEDVVAGLVAMIRDIKAVRIESAAATHLAEYGLTEGASRLTVGLAGAGGIQKTLVFGAATKDENVYATVRGQDVVFVLRRETVAALTRKLVFEP